jgi:hypothetical protein
MNADKEYELMKRQVEAHEQIAAALENISKHLASVLVRDEWNDTVCVRVAQI